ncbi:hypothetical protein DEU56DRAFT_757892 [Suillus clintonianus]|uniref:uncharacterized protein n=1 Tax=Suillus clintonianus TaxID=1904413 RepID=UPI001B872284|nr:uncharacterized protein DEU56DRAFT_757892 [Suillus clintonianus]KAG2130215.1 hypothetical protein DEU56DRAFT_757892 [Suillus clintonianus]
MTTCISPELFDYSSYRTSISQLSSLLGHKFMDAYIGLTANQKVVGERSIEAKQEETLARHQTICHGDDGGRHAAVERFLMEERKKRCNMEVSLYSQAIGMLEQLRMHICDWSKRNGACSNTAVGHLSSSCLPHATHQGRIASVILMCPTISLQRISPSLPLLSTWITVEIQEAFYDAFRTELRTQAELMTKSVATRRSNTYLRNLGLDLLILQAKMCRAKAEIQLYTLAIQNTYESDSSDCSEHKPTGFSPTADVVAGSQTSWDQTIPQPPPPEELNCYDEDIDGTDDCDDCDTDSIDTEDDEVEVCSHC